MEINQNKNELHLYPINDNECIGAINVDATGAIAELRTVFVLDASGSMKDETERFIRDIFPLVMSKLHYSETDMIDLISFGRECIHEEVPVEHFVRNCSYLKSDGATTFAPAINKLRLALENIQLFHPKKLVRVLVISDGAIEDHDIAERAIKKLIDFLDRSEQTINAQAVRLFTSPKQPDTKALAYLLQINNATTSNLCDIKATESTENIANAIASLFQSDGFRNSKILAFETSIVLKFPWNDVSSKRVTLVPGWNIFWLKRRPIGAVKLDDKVIKVIIEQQLNLDTFHQLLETKVAYIADHMTILNVVGSTESIRIVDKISEYFQKIEKVLALKGSTPNKKIITNLFDGIAKDTTEFSDSQQMADFIRMTDQRIESQREKDKKVREEDERRKKMEAEQKELRRKERKALRQKEQDVGREKELSREVEADQEEDDLRRPQMEADQIKLIRRKIEDEERLNQEEPKLYKQKLEEEEQRFQLQKKLEAGELYEGTENGTFQQQKKPEAESTSGIQHINEKQDSIKKKAAVGNVEDDPVKSNPELSRKNKNSLITTAANKVRQFAGAIRKNRCNDLDPNPIQTVFILDENVSAAKKTWRFTEKIIPLVFSKISYEKSQLIHLLTVVGDKSPVVQMLQSILQTLDVDKRLRILVLSNEDVREHDEIENLVEMLIKFVSGTNFTFEFQVVRLASECQESVCETDDGTTKYQVFDFDAKKSNAFIATHVVGLFNDKIFKIFDQKQHPDTTVPVASAFAMDVGGNRTVDDLPISKCEFCRANARKYHCGYYTIFLIIFAVPILLLLFDIFICFRKK